MGEYDRRLWDAKQAVTEMLCNLQAKDTKFSLLDLAGRIDDLNKAWDALTDCLVRQRTQRDALIRQLVDDIAEAKKERST